MTVCTRILADDQDAAAQVANSETCTITSPASRGIIASWAGALELEILITFKMDPKRYTLRLHDLTPSDQPCPEAKEVRSLNYLDLSDAKPVVSGAYEVHFVLKDNIPPPTIEDLRSWQQRWDVIAANPAPPPEKTTVTFCHMNKRPMRVDIASLLRPFACDVQSAMRSKLGLMSEKELFQTNFGKVFGVDLATDDVSFHFTSETCEDSRDIDELRTVPFEAGQAIRVHIRSAEAEAEAEAPVPVAKVAKRKKKKSKKKRNREA
jgi:hypothetical protein